MSNCFCHFGGYEVKDAQARRDIASLQEQIKNLPSGGGSEGSDETGYVIDWDGNKNNLSTIIQVDDHGTAFYCLVSDKIPSNEELKNSIVTLGEPLNIETPLLESYLQYEGYGFVTDDFALVEGVMVVRKDNITVDIEGVTLTFTHAGTYFMWSEEIGYVSKLTIPGEAEEPLNFEAHLNSYTNTEGTTHKTPAMTFTGADKEYVLVRSKQQVSSNAVVLSLTVDRTGNRLVVTTYHEADGFGTYYVPFSS